MSAIPTSIFALTIVLFLVIQSPLGKLMRPHHAELEKPVAEELATQTETPPAGQARSRRRRRKDVAPVMQVIVSIAMLGCALGIILSPEFASKDKHWAYATAGLVCGFWLKE
jgi:hypothetical protein